MRETQQTISQWAEETFGPSGSHFRRVVRANEEMAELLRSVARDEIHAVPGELADVAIVLCRVADKWDIDMVAEADHLTNYDAADLEHAVITANTHMSALLYYTSRTAAKHPLVHLFIALRNAANLVGVDLWKEVEKKMAINRERKWARDGSGHGYHVKKEQVA